MYSYLIQYNIDEYGQSTVFYSIPFYPSQPKCNKDIKVHYFTSGYGYISPKAVLTVPEREGSRPLPSGSSTAL